MATVQEVKEECPTCRGAGITSIRNGLPEEAVVCFACEGKGWRLVRMRAFSGRPPRRAGVKVVRRSLGACAPLDVARTGHLMSYDEFERHFPA